MGLPSHVAEPTPFIPCYEAPKAVCSLGEHGAVLQPKRNVSWGFQQSSEKRCGLGCLLGAGRSPWGSLAVSLPACRQLPIPMTGLLSPNWPWQLSGILRCQLPGQHIHLFPPWDMQIIIPKGCGFLSHPIPCPSVLPWELFQFGI